MIVPQPPGEGRDLQRSAVRSHRECSRVLGELTSCLRNVSEPDGARRVSDCVGRFATVVREMFDRVERSEIYTDLPVRVPRLAGRLERLHAEHRQILDELSWISSAAPKLTDAGGDERRRFQARTQRLIETIQSHDVAENELLQTAYWREVGAGD